MVKIDLSTPKLSAGNVSGIGHYHITLSLKGGRSKIIDGNHDAQFILPQ
jgi:hypothetical protein